MKRSIVRGVCCGFLFGLAAGVVACEEDGGGCEADVDCKGERICVAGACVAGDGGSGGADDGDDDDDDEGPGDDDDDAEEGPDDDDDDDDDDALHPDVVQIGALQWYRRDNGEEVTHPGAEGWVLTLDVDGGGWRLPSAGELSSIYDEGGFAYPVQVCSGQGHVVDEAFDLRCSCFWSDTDGEDGEKLVVCMSNGGVYEQDLGAFGCNCAMAVRDAP